MEELEYAYYLDEYQLLFLLSLIDQRPVFGIFPDSEKIINHEDWQPVILSLIQTRRIYFKNAQLVMDPELGQILLAIKNASRVLTVFNRRGAVPVRLLYLGPEIAAVEILEKGGFRLHWIETPLLLWLVSEETIPNRTEPEALLQTLEENEALQAHIAKWQERALPLKVPPARWQAFPEVWSVVECTCIAKQKNPQEYARERWIWLETLSVGLILHQKPGEIQIDLDTDSRRQQLIRDWEMEAEDAVS